MNDLVEQLKKCPWEPTDDERVWSVKSPDMHVLLVDEGNSYFHLLTIVPGDWTADQALELTAAVNGWGNASTEAKKQGAPLPWILSTCPGCGLEIPPSDRDEDGALIYNCDDDGCQAHFKVADGRIVDILTEPYPDE